ncbi:MAG: type II toxin-antitoxin system HicB family antitoxin [Candidatus Thermoplasmatota archaeon]|nr:type II toxin-antitoxin system HicB family antitoxin [Candidatus Thermoplasmatota archaeon]
MKVSKKLSAVIHKEGKWYVSLCPELDVASQGRTIEAAVKNLQEAAELYLEDEDIKLPESSPIVTMFEVMYDKTTCVVRASDYQSAV